MTISRCTAENYVGKHDPKLVSKTSHCATLDHSEQAELGIKVKQLSVNSLQNSSKDEAHTHSGFLLLLLGHYSSVAIEKHQQGLRGRLPD